MNHLEPIPKPPLNTRILVTGATGQVGGELLQTLAPLGNIVAPTRAELDLTDPASIRACVRSIQPSWVVNAAAYTAVDKAESEPHLAYAINTEAVRILGEESHAIGAPILHFSTDYVFNGQGTQPYLETDPTGPLGVYGASKLAGELALQQANPAHLIFRTSWVYGATGKNFLLTILNLARERQELRIVADQHGAPTWSRDLASMTAHIISSFKRQAATTSTPEALQSIVADRAGLYHASAAGETTWAAFAEEAIRQIQTSAPSTKLAVVTPIPTTAYPTTARRPSNSRLNCRKLEDTFDWKMPPWQQSLTQVLHPE